MLRNQAGEILHQPKPKRTNAMKTKDLKTTKPSTTIRVKTSIKAGGIEMNHNESV